MVRRNTDRQANQLMVPASTGVTAFSHRGGQFYSRMRAVKVTGSPFNTFADAEAACNKMPAAGAVAAGAAGLTAVPALAVSVDPVFAAIDAHAQSVATVQTLRARLLRMIGGDMAVA
jgi:hypothetical protein